MTIAEATSCCLYGTGINQPVVRECALIMMVKEMPKCKVV